MADEKRPQNPDYRLALWIGAAVLVGVAIMIGVDWETDSSVPTSSGNASGTRGMAPPPAAPPPPQSPRQLADQLFNRAMMAHETGQTQEAAIVLPEAIAAYRGLEPLDADGLFHLALLQLADGDAAGARVAADRILAAAPNNLLGLAVAAQASEQSSPAEARVFWQRYLDVFDAEQGRAPEYAHHQQLFPIMKNRAMAFIAGVPIGDAPQ